MRGGWVERGTVLIRLSRPHFAFFRGYLDGLDVGKLARRYLETAIGVEDAARDRRIAQSAVEWIRTQLIVAAHRTHNEKLIRLLKLEPERLRVVYASNVPTLEQFQEEVDPDGGFRESELIELFTERYGAGTPGGDRKAKRNDRLRAKQLQALWQIESLVDADPKITDGVEGWIDPAIAKRLKEAGIDTLLQLVEGIRGLGHRWYRKVPKVGAKAAAQIVRWLTEPLVADALGVTLHVRALVRKSALPETVPAVYAKRTGIVPLENLFLPRHLDGSAATNRGERSLLTAHDDQAAIEAWLSRCKPDSHTRRSYRKEAERLLLWAIVEKGKPISSLTVEDCIDYRDFLWHLGRMTPADWAKRFQVSQDRWLGMRGIPRWSPAWKPFEGPLSNGSQKTALVIAQALCQWLTEQHYLHGNPFKSVGKLARNSGKIDVSRALTFAEWKIVKDYLASLPSDTRYHRLRFILVLAYSTGLRLSEMATLTKRDIKAFSRAGESDTQWEIHVTGKGGVTRAVQLNLFVANEIRHYFMRRGHASFEAAHPDAPLIASLEAAEGKWTADVPLSASRLYDILKDFFADVANTLGADQFEAADRIRKASTHWLRHTFATHALHNGMSLEVVRDLLGHKSLSTTSVYVTTERDNRSREVEKLASMVVL